MSNIKIYKSSAGSGKTYTLVKEYLLKALSHPNAYKEILALTFTNKAAYEMKSRILELLKHASDKEHKSLIQDIADELEIDYDTAINRASILLKDIVNNYTKLSMSTIDSFFQNILRSYTYDLKMENDYSIEFDTNFIIDSTVNILINIAEGKLNLDEGHSAELSSLLLKFSESRLEQGLSWNIVEELKKFGLELLSQKFLQREKAILDYSNSTSIKEYSDNVNTRIKEFENNVSMQATEILGQIDELGIRHKDFKYGEKGFISFLIGLKEKSSFKLTKRALDSSESPQHWVSKNKEELDIIISKIEEHLFDKYSNLIEYLNKYSFEYFSFKAQHKYLFMLGLVRYFMLAFREFREINNTILISDTDILIKKLIDGNDTPLIFEKTGLKYHHFMFDEFQDVSILQWENLNTLVQNSISEQGSSFFVGDTKQSIYRWRGGDPSILNSKVEKDYSQYGLESNNLNTNWRSDKEIIEFNNRFFTLISRTLIKKLSEDIVHFSSNEHEEASCLLETLFKTYDDCEQTPPLHHNSSQDSGPKVKIIPQEKLDENSLKDMIAELEKLQDQGFENNQIAILVRDNKEATQVADQLDECKKANLKNKTHRSRENLHKLDERYSKSIENEYSKQKSQSTHYRYDYSLISHSTLSSDPQVNLVISFYKWILDRSDKVSFYEFLYFYKLHSDASIGRSCIDESVIFSLPTTTNEYLKLLPQNLSCLITECLSIPIHMGFLRIVKVLGLNFNTNLQKLYESIINISSDKQLSIQEFIKWWKQKGNRIKSQTPDEAYKINIMTIHQSKGLQFDVVIMPYCNWELDHPARKPPIIWIENKDNPSSPPFTPVQYSKDLMNTSFDLDYFKEKAKIHLDNLNLLYVAFTRAKKRMIIYNEENKKKGIFTVSDLISFYLENQNR